MARCVGSRVFHCTNSSLAKWQMLIMWHSTIRLGNKCNCVVGRTLQANHAQREGDVQKEKSFLRTATLSAIQAIITVLFSTCCEQCCQALRLTWNYCHGMVQQDLPVFACPEKQRSSLGVGRSQSNGRMDLQAIVSVLEKCAGETVLETLDQQAPVVAWVM